MTELYGILVTGPDRGRLNVALQAAVVKAQEHSTGITILVPALRHVAGTILSDVIGEALVRNLAKNRPVTLNEIPVNMYSIQTVSPTTLDGVVVALWGGDKMLEKLDRAIASKVPKTIIVLSWNDEEVAPWCKQNDAAILDV